MVWYWWIRPLLCWINGGTPVTMSCPSLASLCNLSRRFLLCWSAHFWLWSSQKEALHNTSLGYNIVFFEPSPQTLYIHMGEQNWWTVYILWVWAITFACFYSSRRLVWKKNVGVVSGSSRFVLATVVGLNHGQSNHMASKPLTWDL